MNNNRIALNYNEQVLTELQKTCTPLFNNSCVKSFRYFRIFSDGTYINLSTNHEWLRERIDSVPDNGASFHSPLCNSSEKDYTFYLWEPNQRDPIMELKKKHNISNGISLYKRKEDSVEAWSFGATLEDALAPNFYINNTSFLRQFILHFNTTAKPLITPRDNSVYAKFEKPISIENQNCLKNKQAINQLASNRSALLSPRELESLDYISKGKTYKGTAAAMNISPRTVETYIQNIKQKLNVSNKQQIIDYFWKEKSRCFHNI